MDTEDRSRAVAPSFLLWSLFLVNVVLAGALTWNLATGDPTALPAARPSAPTARAVAVPQVAGTPTFADAAASMRRGRHAEAYGRFVALAEDGDVDAARMALLMHRLGPSVFGSHWDATPEQIHDWTRRSQAAEDRDLEDLRLAASGQRAP